MKRLWTTAMSLTLLFALALGHGCSVNKDTGGEPERICTPGANVYCRCRGGVSDGTKLCLPGGREFGQCEPCDESGDSSGIDTGATEEDTGPLPDVVVAETSSDAADKCPGQTIAVDPTKDTVIVSDTTTATDDGAGGGACAVGTGKDHVYAVIPTGTGRLTVKMTGTGTMDPTLYARGDDCATGKQLACAESTGATGTEQISFDVITGKTYWIWADGKAGTSGTYTINFHLQTGPVCGDNKVDPGEGCDDGNKVAADGCGNDCRPEGDPVGAGKCPGMDVHVWGTKVLSFDGSTLPYPNTYKSDACAFGSSAQDRVYSLHAHKTGMMKVDVTATYNVGIYVKKDPCATGIELVCGNDIGTSIIPQTEKVTFPVTDGNTYYLFVDGALSYKGTFTVAVSIP